MKKIFYYKTKIGEILIGEKNNAISNIYVDNKVNIKEAVIEESKLIKETYIQIQEYLDGKRKEFNVPIILEGTEFQKKVWDTLMRIPYGETWTYKRIAEEIGNPKACRAVGMANNKNPILILVPCHRVIGSNGKLVGYAGGMEVKEYLLSLEKGSSIYE